MDTDRAQQDMKKFLSKILIEGLTEENYIDLKFRLKKYDDNNIYLIYLLNILGINSQMLDLIIKQYELKYLIDFLDDENIKYLNPEITQKNLNNQINNQINNQTNNQTNSNNIECQKPPTDYTEEDALKEKFTDDLPPIGAYQQIKSVFVWRANNKTSYKCIRTYKIDHEGNVVKYYGQELIPLSEPGLCDGALHDLIFPDEIKEANESDL